MIVLNILGYFGRIKQKSYAALISIYLQIDFFSGFVSKTEIIFRGSSDLITKCKSII